MLEKQYMDEVVDYLRGTRKLSGLERDFRPLALELKNDIYKHMFLVSSNNKNDVDKILSKIVENLPEHPAFYSKEELTDKNERFIVSEIVRGEIFKSFSQEVPYSTYVEINTFKNEENILRIEGYIYVETESQKSILLGKKGKKTP